VLEEQKFIGRITKVKTDPRSGGKQKIRQTPVILPFEKEIQSKAKTDPRSH
jgi:hypothetical protein